MQKLSYAVVRDCDEWVEAGVKRLGGYHHSCVLSWMENERLETLAGLLTVADFDDLSYEIASNPSQRHRSRLLGLKSTWSLSTE